MITATITTESTNEDLCEGFSFEVSADCLYNPDTAADLATRVPRMAVEFRQLEKALEPAPEQTLTEGDEQ